MNADLENITKAAQAAELLAQDLRALVSSDNLLLADIAMRELEVAAHLKVRLHTVQTLVEQGAKS